MDADVEPRLRQAVDASLAWYDDIFALHGIPRVRTDVLWHALADPPPYHSTVKTITPGASTEAVVAAAAALDGGSIADSFGDLQPPGFDLLFEAQWLHVPGRETRTMPAGWSVVSRPEALALWCELHDYVGVLPPAVLQHPRITVLGLFSGRDLLGGAVLHDGAEAVGLSNTWSVPEHPIDHGEVLAAARAVHPDRSLTDYASGDELTSMLDAGFEPVGPQRVWVRR